MPDLPPWLSDAAIALEQGRRCEAVAGYAGIRVDSGGRRFRLEKARLWSLRDGTGQPAGQAAAFDTWWWLPEAPGGSPPPAGEEAEPGWGDRT